MMRQLERIFVLALLLCSALCLAPVLQEIKCGRGSRFKKGQDGSPDTCEPCGPGWYQPNDNHRISTCHKCHDFKETDHVLRLEDECTRFHDTVLRCVDKRDYYVYNTDGGSCLPCTNCSSKDLIEGQPCSDTVNTVCCKAHEEFRNGACVDGPLRCGPGEFLVPEQAGGGKEMCKPCRNKSENASTQHRKEYCGEPDRMGDGQPDGPRDGDGASYIKECDCTLKAFLWSLFGFLLCILFVLVPYILLRQKVVDLWRCVCTRFPFQSVSRSRNLSRSSSQSDQ